MPKSMTLSVCLLDLFGPFANFLAKWVGFIIRERKLTGSSVARACVFTWMANPRAPLEDIADDLGVSPQALQQHLGPRSHAFFRSLLAEILRRLGKARFLAHSLGLLKAFPAVVTEDCTSISLPADLAHLFPGCGGNMAGYGAASLKILLRYELKTGSLLAISFHPGRCPDVNLAAQPKDLPHGCLYLADMGFFDAARLAVLAGCCSWITRIPATTCVRVGKGRWQGLTRWLADLQEEVADVRGELVESFGLPCRLVALRCPQEVVARRRQKLREKTRKKKGREPSAAQLAACEWTTFATNVSEGVLKAREVWTAYRCRWQVELLIKRAKGLAGWSFTHGSNGNRVMAELLAKVLGLIVMHWVTLQVGPALAGRSATRMMRRVTQFAQALGQAIRGQSECLPTLLQILIEDLARIKPRRKRRRKPNTKDLLDNPALAPRLT